MSDVHLPARKVLTPLRTQIGVNPDYAEKYFGPKWLDPKWCRRLVMPPHTSLDEQRDRAPFQELPGRKVVLPEETPEHTLAQLGLRAQRRYGIAAREWRRRWGKATV